MQYNIFINYNIITGFIEHKNSGIIEPTKNTSDSNYTIFKTQYKSFRIFQFNYKLFIYCCNTTTLLKVILHKFPISILYGKNYKVHTLYLSMVNNMLAIGIATAIIACVLGIPYSKDHLDWTRIAGGQLGRGHWITSFIDWPE